MSTYKGFNTIEQRKKFGLTDFDLIKRDLLNALNIKAGSVPGRPDLGTNIWNFVFEPITNELIDMLEAEIQQLIDNDGRLESEQIDISTSENTIIIEIAVIIKPKMDAEKLFVIFNKDIQDVNIISL